MYTAPIFQHVYDGLAGSSDPSKPCQRDVISRVLKPDGRFCFIDVVRTPLIPRLRTLVPPNGLASKDELVQLLRETGFNIERWRGWPGLGLVITRKA